MTSKFCTNFSAVARCAASVTPSSYGRRPLSRTRAFAGSALGKGSFKRTALLASSEQALDVIKYRTVIKRPFGAFTAQFAGELQNSHHGSVEQHFDGWVVEAMRGWSLARQKSASGPPIFASSPPALTKESGAHRVRFDDSRASADRTIGRQLGHARKNPNIAGRS